MGLRWRSCGIFSNLFLFLYLKAFGGTGGIEKFNRAMMKALDMRREQKAENIQVLSAYDTEPDPAYFSAQHFQGFGVQKLSFTLAALSRGIKARTLLIGHINLSIIGLLLKTLRPGQKQILVTHGVEVWGNLSITQKGMLRAATQILTVSHFTRNILIEKHGVAATKVSIFRNTLDPSFVAGADPDKIALLRKHYEIPEEAGILLTIARLQHYEQAKGYDKVIEVVARLKAENKIVYYILGGKYSDDEYCRIQRLAEEKQVEQQVILPGYLSDEDLRTHYCLANVFIMPSTKEGFGIVFIEAMANGTPVIAGNRDGSRDTVLSPELGSLVDPGNLEEILEATRYWLQKGKSSARTHAHLIAGEFGFSKFCERVNAL